MNNNGLLSSSETHPGPPNTPAYFAREEAIDVISLSTIISAPTEAGNPLYIKNPNNIGTAPLSDNALIIEGGNNRSLTDPASGVGLAITKPFTSGVGEDIGTLSMYGKDASGAEARYAYIRAGSRGNAAGNVKGSMQLMVAGAILELDGSANIFNTTGDIATQLRGSLTVGDVTKADRTMLFVDTSGTYNIPFSVVNRISGAVVSSVLPGSGAAYTFIPRYSGTYCVEMTCGFGGAGATFNNTTDAIGFVVTPGGSDDYGASIAAARTITNFPTTAYTCSSLHSFTAGVSYVVTMRYVGTPVLGANGAFLIEVSLI